MPTRRIQAVVFDVNETLTDLDPLRDVFVDLGLPGSTLHWWFAVLLRDGFALATVGDHAAFTQLATTALDEVAAGSGRTLPEGSGERLVEAFGRVPVHHDVAPALAAVASAGVKAFALTNGSAALARRILTAAGVVDSFADVVSVDAIGHWKPRPEPYEWVIEMTAVPRQHVAMVAAHPWDLHGAATVGLTTGWVNRGHAAYPGLFRAPTVASRDLQGVINSLLALDQ